MAALAIEYAETAADTTAGFTSTQPANPCSEALSIVALAAEPNEPAPNQLAEVAAVLIIDAAAEAW
jgi:hypothetical protein